MRAVSLKSTELAPLSTEVLARGGALRFEAHGGSMAPFIRAGDLLTVEPAAADGLRVGDVALYRRAGNDLVVHRVIARRFEDGQIWLTLRGDAAPGAAEQVAGAQASGRVVRLQRGARVIRLDRKIDRLLAWLWHGCAFRHLWAWTQVVKRAAFWSLGRLQGTRTYRAAAGRLIGKRARYRSAALGDAPQLARLYAYDRLPELGNPVTSFGGQMESLQGYGQILVASVGDRIAGAAIMRRFPGDDSMYPDWWLFGMLVRTRYRGAGIGAGLARLALAQASAEGATRINLTVFEQNHAAIHLYRKLGFRPACIPGLDEQLAEEAQRGAPRRIIMSKSL
jgi:signal peptidase I